MIPKSSNNQISALLWLTINSNWRKYHTLLTVFKVSMPSFWIQRGEEESLSRGNLIGKKREKIANISCLKISIFRFSWRTPHRIPKQRRKRKSWRKTSHTSRADFLHKPRQFQTLKAKLLSILIEQISDFGITGYEHNFNKTNASPKLWLL